MEILVVGTGKLAREILSNLQGSATRKVVPWTEGASRESGKNVVVHAGSGRELSEVYAYCALTGSVLVELATNTDHRSMDPEFPVVVCPNTNMLLLRVMALLARYGHWFQGYERSILESHQASKTSEPGTAFQMADALGIDRSEIESVRDPIVQERVLGIPREHLERHAHHRIEIGDGSASVTLETTVLGQAPYADGLGEILDLLDGQELEPGVHDILEFLDGSRVSPEA